MVRGNIFEDPSFPMVFGRDVPIAPKFSSIPQGGNFDRAVIVSSWEISAIVQVILNGQIIDPSLYELVIVDQFEGQDVLPIVSQLEISSGVIPRGESANFLYDNLWVVVDGIKHYAYDANGDIDGSHAAYHQMIGGSPGAVTNPVWVAVHIMMNEYGLEWDRIDWVTARWIAEWCEEADWSTVAGTPNLGYDLRFKLDEPEAMEEVMEKIRMAGGFDWNWSGGKVKFYRMFETTNDYFRGGSKSLNPGASPWCMEFTAANIVEDTFEVMKVDEFTLPTKFTVKYQRQAQDDLGRRLHLTNNTPFSFEEKRRDFESNDEEKIDVYYLYDEDDFRNTDGESLPMLNALLEMRRQIFAREYFKFTTPDLRAYNLEPGDPVRFTYTHITATYTNQECTVREIQIQNDGRTVSLTLDPHNDDWYQPDPNASIEDQLSVTADDPSDFPTWRFRFKDNSPIKLEDEAGGTLDARVVKVGAQLFQYNTSGDPGTDTNWATPTKWQYIGEIATVSVDQDNDEVTITLTASADTTIVTSRRVQVMPTIVAGHGSKYGQNGGEWLVRVNIDEPGWTFFGSPSVEFVDDTYTSGADWQPLNVVLDRVNDGTNPVYWQGMGFVPVPYDEAGYAANTTAGRAGSSTIYPLCLRFRKRNSFGGSTTSEEYFYGFVHDLVVLKEFSIVSLTAQSSEIGSDWTEVFGFTLVTNYDQDDHGAVKFAEVKARDKSADGAITNANWDDGDSILLYRGPIFRAITFADEQGEEIGEVYSVGLKTLTEAGVYTQTSGTDNISVIDLTKVSRMFDKYTGVLNTYNSGGSDYRGSGGLWTTNAWATLHPNWDSGASPHEYMGGFYLYKPHDPAGTADVSKWRRFSIDTSGTPDVFEENGPTVAFEVTGDSKMAYQNIGGAISNEDNESGILFATHYGPGANYHGEYWIGLGKSYGRTFYTDFETQNGNVGIGDIGHTGTFTIYEQLPGEMSASFKSIRGAAWYQAKTHVGDDRPLHTIANGLYVNGLMIGPLRSDPHCNLVDWETPTSGVTLFTVDPSDRSVGSLCPPLIGYGGVFGFTAFANYAYVDGFLGKLFLPNLYIHNGSWIGTGTDRYLPIGITDSGGDNDDRFVYWSPSNQYAVGPGTRSSNPSGTPIEGAWFIYENGTTYEFRAYVNGGWRSIALT